jgi:AcrR family transcriptional regulator
MPRPKDPALEARRREMVLDAAQALLAESSWMSVTLEAVAQRAEVSKGVVTYWFRSKDALIVAAVERFHEQYAAKLARVAALELPPRERLEMLIALAFPSRAQVTREVRFQAEVWSYAKANPAVAASIREAYASFRLATDALIAMGRDAGYITTERTDDLHRFVHALVDGLSLHIAFDERHDVAATRRQLLARLEDWFRAP